MVLSKDARETRDPHVRTFWEKCDICLVDYDAIGHLETWEEDMSFILNKVSQTWMLSLF